MKPSEFLKEDSFNQIQDVNLKDVHPSRNGTNDEYGMEGSYVKNQIHTIKRVLTHLENALGDDEDLPEWVEDKISQAKGMIVSLMDYIISEKEREIERVKGRKGAQMAENVSGGGTGSSAVSSSMGGGDGFGWSEFYKESTKPAAKRKSNMRKR